MNKNVIYEALKSQFEAQKQKALANKLADDINMN
mgnify:CR=1 FL=1